MIETKYMAEQGVYICDMNSQKGFEEKLRMD